MASQQPENIASVPAPTVASSFVDQYYFFLHQFPELVYRFYEDPCKLGRHEEDDSRMQAINKKIQSFNLGGCNAELVTVDAQDSLGGGVIVLVVGNMIRKDDKKRKFNQSFFLAPNEKGYFILNDIFQYVDSVNSYEGNQVTSNVVMDPQIPKQELPLELKPKQKIEQMQKPESSPKQGALEHVALPLVKKVDDEELVQLKMVSSTSKLFHEQNGLQIHATHSNNFVHKVSEIRNSSRVDEANSKNIDQGTPKITNNIQADTSHSNNTSQLVSKNQSNLQTNSTNCSDISQQEPKMSYASVVKLMMENHALPSTPMKSPTSKIERKVASPPRPLSPVETDGLNLNNIQSAKISMTKDEHSIYVKNLPMNVSPARLEDELRRFGPIKSNGIQVRCNKVHRVCFAFVEFVHSIAAQSAIEASPLIIDGRPSYVEQKRSCFHNGKHRHFQNIRGERSNGGYINEGNRGHGGGPSYSYNNDENNIRGGAKKYYYNRAVVDSSIKHKNDNHLYSSSGRRAGASLSSQSCILKEMTNVKG